MIIYCHLVYLLICLQLTIKNQVASQSVFESPKIIVRDGKVIIQSAPDRDVAFETIGKGRLLINNSTLVKNGLGFSLVNQAIDSLSRRLNDLEKNGNNENALATFSPSNDSPSDDLVALAPVSTKVGLINTRVMNNTRRISKLRRQLNDLNRRFFQLLSTVTRDECSSDPCKNGGTCIDKFDGFYCQCNSQFEGTTCENDVNECAAFAGTELGCQNGGKCINTHGGYRCECPPDKYGIHCTEQHEDCYSSSNIELCGHGTCINSPRIIAGQPKYTCFCDQGWKSDGNSPACTVDIDECSLTRYPCSLIPKVECINLPGTFHCGHCPPGFTGNGHSCGDIDECATDNGGCSVTPRVQCINTHGSRVCGACPPGFEGDGVTCVYVGICRINNGGCSPIATCLDNGAISASFRECFCPLGYIGSGVGELGCIPRSSNTGESTSVCYDSYCVHGTCHQLNNQSIKCTCFPGYTGIRCETSIALIGASGCSRSPCANGGTCIASSTAPLGYICLCAAEWDGNDCTVARDSCGGTLEGPSGSLVYPNAFANSTYESSQDCAWIIKTEPHLVLNITFRSFDIERSATCSYDYLQIHDGRDAGSYKIGRYCGTDIPSSIVSSHDSVYLWFHSDSTTQSEGFALDFNSTTPVCGGLLDAADYGTINSPGYPGNYPHSRDCMWTVQVPLGKRIQFHFAFLSIELHPDCTYDYLRVHDGPKESDPLLKTFCNSTLPPPITTSGSSALLHFHSDNTMSDKGFHLTYTSIPSVPGCGGLITRDRGSFSSPNFPDVYTANIECDWVIRVHPNERIRLTFVDFELESQSNCMWDYVAIYDGPDQLSPLLSRSCGSSPPPPLFSTSESLYIKFASDASHAGRGFKAEYETICGETLTGDTGILKSPYYPSFYPADRECTYTIRVAVGKVIILQFLDFNIEESQDCAYDYLEIRDGGVDRGSPLKKLCGTHLPDKMISSFNELWLKFRTDGSENNLGFLANYSTIDIDCGGILSTDHGFFSSPSRNRVNHFDPLSIAQEIKCQWLIRAPVNFVIRINFPTFNLLDDTNCTNNYLLLEDYDSNQLGKFCSNRPPSNILSTGDHVLVTYFAAPLINSDFTATYSFENVSVACGGQIFSQTGYVRSPNYPHKYPSRKDCIWTIIAPDGKQIHIQIDDNFDIEGHISCAYDFLELRNGGEAVSPLIDRYCNRNMPPKQFISHSNRLYIHFHSDNNMNGDGFQLFFDAGNNGCGGTLTAPSGTIESPNYPSPYAHHAECNWLISISSGSTIHLMVSDIEIENHPNCPFDYLEIFDGDSEHTLSLGKICSSQSSGKIFYSTGNKMYIKFKADESKNGRGFRLSYFTNCTTLITGFRGIIDSPNFPQGYPGELNCSWRIEAPLGNNITFGFSTIDLEDSTNCTLDRVQVFQLNKENNSYQSLVTQCGDHSYHLPPAFNTSSNEARVDFISDGTIGPVGFRLEWMAIGCGGDFVNKPEGTITSPNYPYGYPVGLSCIWHIRGEPGEIIQLRFIDFDMEGAASGCTFDYVKIFSGLIDSPTNELATLCHKMSPKQMGIISSSSNIMTIKLYSDHSVTGKGFKAKFTIRRGSCNSIIRNIESGTITSPNYPNSFVPKDSNIAICRWYINVKPLHTISFEILNINIPSSDENCTDNSVSIFDEFSSRESKLLTTLCGDSLPTVTSFKTTGPHASIIMRINKPVKGFRIKFETSCGGVKYISKSEYGLFTSPNYPLGSVVIQQCSWTFIAADPGEKVTLLFARIFGVNYGDNGDCENQNTITVRDGNDDKAPLLARYCSDLTPKPVTSNGNSLHVELNGIMVFRAVYYGSVSICGFTTLTSSEGFFVSPGYPNNYPLNSECIWIIRAPKGNTVSFTLTSLDIESSEFCNSDYLELRENSSDGKFIGRFCGNSIPNLSSNSTSSNSLWIKFRSDDEGSARGFEGYFTLVHGNYLNGSSGEIESPGWPWGLFSSSQPFKWTITTPPSTYVRITFTDFEIPLDSTTTECKCVVKILDGFYESSPEIASYCGYQIPASVISHSNVITVLLDPNDVDAKHAIYKFKLRWEAIDSSDDSSVVTVQSSENVDSSSCFTRIHLNLTGSTTIESPGYPFGYASSLDCTWLITTHPGYHVSLKVNQFELEAGTFDYLARLSLSVENLCRYDVVSLYQWSPSPPTPQWSLNTSLCGSKKAGSTYQLLSDQVRIHFVTDFLLNRTGFSFDVSSQCGGYIHSSGGKISSDMLTQGNCSWSISVRPGRKINLELTVNNHETTSTSSTSCSSGFIVVRTSPTAPIIGRYCSTWSLGTIESSNAYIEYVHLYPVFRKDSLPFTFELEFNEISESCGGYRTITEDWPGYIVSPNYPHSPPHDTFCDWTFIGPPGRILRIDFDQFSSTLSPDSSNIMGKSIQKQCSPDNSEYIVVKDGGTIASPELNTLCIPVSGVDSIRSTGNMLFVRFVTTGVSMKTAFRAAVHVDICGGIVYVTYVVTIQGPFKDKKTYDNNMRCVYTIKSALPQYSLIISTREPLDIPNEHADTSITSSCSSSSLFGDYLEIRDENEDGPLLGRFCNNQTIQPQIMSQSDTVIVTFRSDFANVGRGFKLIVAPNWRPCGGFLELSAASSETTGTFITSPNYPDAFNSARRCTWRLRVPPDSRAILQIIEYNLKANPTRATSTGSTECLDKLTIKNHWVPYTSDLPCGDSIINSQLIGQKIDLIGSNEISFFTNGLAVNEGFKIKYWKEEELSCGGLLDKNTGIISSLNKTKPSIFNSTSIFSTINCLWRLNVAGDNIHTKKTVSIVFDIFEVPDIRSSSNVFYQPCGDSVFALGRGFYIKERYCRNRTKINEPFIIIAPPPVDSMNMFFTLTIRNNVQNYRGIHGTYYVQECGGDYFNPNGSYISPGYTSSSYPANSICQWVFTSHSNAIEIDLSDFSMNGNCDENNLQILAGAWFNAPRVNKFCSHNLPNEKIRTRDTMVIRLKTGVNNLSGKFNFTVNSIISGCGGYISHPMYPTHHPGFPDRYPNNAECIWYIQEDSSHSINITFTDRFDIQISDNCKKDYIIIEEMYAGTWITLARLCGVHSPKSIKTRSNIARITFRSDSSINADGFTFHYNAVCSITLTEEEGIITSPNYPSNYPNGLSCDYLISQPDKFISLEFEDFSIEGKDDTSLPGPSDCTMDTVTVYLSNSSENSGQMTPKMGPYCGSDKLSKPPTITSFGAILISFRTDTSVSSTGFKARYSTFKCGGSFTTDPENTFLPIYVPPASSSLSSINCTWTITTTSKSTVVYVRFVRVESKCTNCRVCPRLRILDGPSTSSPLLLTACSKNELTNAIIKSSNETLTVQLVGPSSSSKIDLNDPSDDSDRSQFAMVFGETLGPSQGCGGFIHPTKTSGTIKLLTHTSGQQSSLKTIAYAYPLDCNWLIIANDSDKIKITLSQFSFPINGYLEIRDGPLPSSPLIDRMYNVTKHSIISSQEYLYIHLHTGADPSFPFDTFQFGYEWLSSSSNGMCGGNVEATSAVNYLNVSNGPLMSSVYDKVTSNHNHIMVCRWHLSTASHRETIALNFTHVSISCDDNESIYIRSIRHHDTHLPMKFCGHIAPERIYASSEVLITYQTTGISSSGFNLQYSLVGCNATYHDETGVISSPNDPYVGLISSTISGQQSVCISTIEVDPGRTITIYFVDVELHGNRRRGESSCAEGKIEIRPGDAASSSPNLATICGTGNPNPIFSFTNKLSIFITSSMMHSKYKIIYSSSTDGPGCGGNFTNEEGIFTSPFYPKPYTLDHSCIFVINSRGFQSIQLRFSTFALSLPCTDNYVIVYEGIIGSASEKLISRFCGNDVPATFTSSSSIVSVKLQTSASNSARGFHASYKLLPYQFGSGQNIISSPVRTRENDDRVINLDTLRSPSRMVG